MKFKTAVVLLAVLLSFVMSLSGCIFIEFPSDSMQTDSVNVMIYKTQGTDGKLGYQKIVNLCLTNSKLSLYTESGSALSAAADLDRYFARKNRDFLSYDYAFKNERSNNADLYIFEFSRFDSLDYEPDNNETDDEKTDGIYRIDDYLVYEVSDENIFRDRYTFTFENLLAGIPELFDEGKAFGDINTILPNLDINSFPVNYYIYGGSEHISNDADGTRKLATDDGESVTFGYWKATIGTTPEKFVFYRNMPVSLGWNIVAIAAGVIVTAILVAIVLVKNAKEKKKESLMSEETKENDAREE